MNMPLRSLVGLAVDRCRALAHPSSDEPSPVANGATVAEWARLTGLDGHLPHKAIADTWEHALRCEPHHPETVVHRALQRLTSKSLTERVPGLPLRYRPVRHGPS